MNNITKTQLKIISYLIDNPDQLAGIRELAKEISVVYYLVHQNIQKLKEKNIIQIQKAGKTNIVQLNHDADQSYLIEAERYKRELFYNRYPQLKVTLKKIINLSNSRFFMMLVFGSYTQKPRKDSDIDLLIVVPDEKQAELMGKFVASVARTSTIPLHETIVTEESYNSMLQKKEMNVALEAKEKHILIYGDDLYYKND